MTHAIGRIRWGAAMCVAAGLMRSAWAQEPAPEAASPNPLRAITKDSLTAFRRRPLFSPTRTEAATPDLQVPSAPATPPPEPPSVKLVGLVGGATKFAVVRIGADAKAQILGTGDKVAGWNVTVLDSGMRLELGARSVDIALFSSGFHGKAPMQKKGMSAPAVPDGQAQ